MSHSLAIVGAGSWGTTLAIVYARLGHDVTLWDHEPDRALDMQVSRENTRYVPGISFPVGLRVTGDLNDAVRGCSLVVLATPAQTLRGLSERIAPLIAPHAVVVIAAKGLELGTGRRMSEVVTESLQAQHHAHVAVLSGPNLAAEIVREAPAASVVASVERSASEVAQKSLSTPRFRLYVSSDVVGVELGGALKNVMALAAGLADGLGYGDNSKASLMTRGLAEIARLGVAAGARRETFAGLSGLGDLVATCGSPLSRNHRVGFELGQGRTLSEIQAGMSSVAEGVTTTEAARSLALRYGVEMPIVEQVYTVLFEGKSPHDAVIELLARAAKDELTGALIQP